MFSQQFFVFLALFFHLFLPPAKSNISFRQEVNYTISVRLDDHQHKLHGHIKMQYINNSPDTLTEIFIHLWPNAYKNNQTAFARQKVETGSTRFYFADKKEKGAIDSLHFLVDNTNISWEYDPVHIDIARLILKQPLLPGGQIIIETPFRLKIPASFSRLGHVGTSYQITQWYPKPAVYDASGWHPMPYLDMGEFYSEFGTFNVDITLPANYVVAATGVLQTESEIRFLEDRIEATNQLIKSGFSKNRDYPSSFPTLKTIRFTANEVHDFAWFADKRFHVQKSQVVLDSSTTVDTWAFFTNFEANLWKKATDYLNQSILFYSDKVGTYPWPQATAVQSALSAGGGMEYPMITVIGSSETDQALDEVITHEVGHNWFYGILASNEREFPWMDEGLNSFYEYKYMEEKYHPSESDFLPSFLLSGSDMGLYEAAYLFQASRNLDQQPQQNARLFSSINYFLGAYAKPAAALRLLEAYTGDFLFEEIMKKYYKAWQFRHPKPDDFQHVWQMNFNKDLSWFFDGYLQTSNKVDYAIKKLSIAQDSINIEIKNKGKIYAPFPLTIENKEGEIIHKKWTDGFTKDTIIQLPLPPQSYIVRIDKDNLLWEINRQNNHYHIQSLLPKWSMPRLKLLAGLDHQEKPDIYWSPLIAWNKYDELMAGIGLYNRFLFAKKFEYGLLPLYSFSGKSLLGSGEVKLHFFPENRFMHQVSVGISYRKFNSNKVDNSSSDDPSYATYRRKVPFVEIVFNKPANAHFQHALRLESILLHTKTPIFSIEGLPEGTSAKQDEIWRARYSIEKLSPIHPVSFSFTSEYQKTTLQSVPVTSLKLSIEAIQQITFQPKKQAGIRLFAGFLWTDPSAVNYPLPQSLSLSRQGFNDYAFDDYFMGRSETTGFWSRQVLIKEGGFKQAFGSAYNSIIGQSNDFLISLNIDTDLPGNTLNKILPLNPYFDLAYYLPLNSPESSSWLWSGGLKLEYFKGILGIYLPLLHANPIKDTYKQIEKNTGSKFLGRISFSFDMQKIHPWRLTDKIKF